MRHARISAASPFFETAQTNTTALTGTPKVAVAYDPHEDRFLVTWQEGAIRARTVGGPALGRSSAEFVVSSGYPTTGNAAGVSVAFDPSAKRYLLVAAAGGSFRGYLLSSEFTPAVTGLGAIAPASAPPDHVVTAWPGGFVLTYSNDAQTHITDIRLRGDGQVVATTFVDAGDRVAAASGQNGYLLHAHTGWDGEHSSSAWLTGRGGRPATSTGAAATMTATVSSDLFLFRNSSQFIVRTHTGSYAYTNFEVSAGIPALLDWDGDGRTDLCAWRPRYGSWRILLSASHTIETVSLGRGGDIPVPGDYFGWGRDQVAVFRPSTGTWYIDNRRALAETQVAFGQVGDLPVPADWDGDGDIDLGVWRPSTGMWYAARIDGHVNPDVAGAPWSGGRYAVRRQLRRRRHGSISVIYRRSTGRFHLRDGATGDTTAVDHFYGLPVPLDWDGDGRLDLVVADPDNGTWYVFSPSGNAAITGFGSSGDIPAGVR